MNKTEDRDPRTATPRRAPRWLALGASAALLVGMLAACGGGSDSGSEDTGSKSSAKTSSATSSSAPSSKSSAASSGPSGSEVTSSELKAALLTADDIGGDFVDGDYEPGASPLPCAPKGSKPLDKQAPPTVSEGAEIDSESLQAQFAEVIKVYEDEASAKAALAIATGGLSCTDGTLYATDGSTVSVTIDGPQDVTDQVGLSDVDSVTEWDFTSDEVSGAYVAARIGISLELFSFLSSVDTDPSTLPDPGGIVIAGLNKIIAAD